MSLEQIEAFSYEGQLVFNGLHMTDILDANFDFDHVIEEELVDYKNGSIGQPGRGYQTLPFADYIADEPAIDRRIEELLGEIHAFRYKEEKWEYRDTEVDGVTDTHPTLRGYSTFDGYWASPDYLFIKSDKSKAETARQLLSETLEDYLSLRDFEFNPDFLLWVFSKEKNNEDLPGNLSVNMLTDAEIRGNEPDLFGQHSKVDDSTDITKSAPVLIGVLSQKGLVALEGVFGLAGRFVRVRIATDGRVHIKADHAIQGSPDIERMAIALAFLREFTDLYQYWMNLDSEYRYPPLEFFTDIYKECERQGVEVTFSIDDVVDEYRQKGSPKDYNEYQSGLSEFEE
ncbi:hypothetical protein [Halorussus halophilus]|uniref:hypothetical protein n=1 Tax=Halorussus halophilus TaxID=2650975 RepID=UPI001300D472|nr:hypothetical protein [Halorussus halophilus]